jgi:RNA polymerase sigma factor (sigma-70 family)
MNAHNPAWFAAAADAEYNSYAEWSRGHPLLTAEQERCWLQQHQDTSLALVRLTQGVSKDWWQQRYPSLDWQQRDWIKTLWDKRPNHADMNALRTWYLEHHDGPTMLPRLWRRLLRAREMLLGSNIRLVFSVAHQHLELQSKLLRVVQEGQLGLMRALEKFDVLQGTRFSTYSHYWIQQFIRLGLKNQAALIRKPTNVVDDLKRFQRQLMIIQQQAGKPLSLAAISKQLSMEETQVRHFLELGLTPFSLDAPMSDDGSESWASQLEATEPTTYESSEQLEVIERIRGSLGVLDHREEVIIALRYGIQHGREYGYREIADQLGVSRERVRQLEKEALKKLKMHWDQPDERAS